MQRDAKRLTVPYRPELARVGAEPGKRSRTRCFSVPRNGLRYQVALGCNGPGGRQVSQRHGPAPDTEWVTGRNQLWNWDVTVLGSSERFVFWYLCSLRDHFSRKAVA